MASPVITWLGGTCCVPMAVRRIDSTTATFTKLVTMISKKGSSASTASNTTSVSGLPPPAPGAAIWACAGALQARIPSPTAAAAPVHPRPSAPRRRSFRRTGPPLHKCVAAKGPRAPTKGFRPQRDDRCLLFVTFLRLPATGSAPRRARPRPGEPRARSPGPAARPRRQSLPPAPLPRLRRCRRRRRSRPPPEGQALPRG